MPKNFIKLGTILIMEFYWLSMGKRKEMLIYLSGIQLELRKFFSIGNKENKKDIGILPLAEMWSETAVSTDWIDGGKGYVRK